MDIRHLKSFIVVAEELNIGRAAVRLHISQPPLTRQIQQLEQELNVQLFVRTPRGVDLTQAGEMFLEEARNIRHLMEQAVERTVRAGQGKLGRLDIGMFGTGIFSVIPELLRLFRVTHPGVRVVLHTMTKGEQIEALRQKRITIGFHRMPLVHPDIENFLLINEPLYMALSEEHELSKHASISFQELKNHPLVLFPTGDRPNFVDKVIEICSGMGFMPDISQVVGDAVTGVALVSAGLGITIVPKSVTTLKIPNVVYRPFDSSFPAYVDLSCVHRKGDQSAILEAFLKVVKNFKTELATKD